MSHRCYPGACPLSVVVDRLFQKAGSVRALVCETHLADRVHFCRPGNPTEQLRSGPGAVHHCAGLAGCPSCFTLAFPASRVGVDSCYSPWETCTSPKPFTEPIYHKLHVSPKKFPTSKKNATRNEAAVLPARAGGDLTGMKNDLGEYAGALSSRR